jgi:hypothetical protein
VGQNLALQNHDRTLDRARNWLFSFSQGNLAVRHRNLIWPKVASVTTDIASPLFPPFTCSCISMNNLQHILLAAAPLHTQPPPLPPVLQTPTLANMMSYFSDLWLQMVVAAVAGSPWRQGKALTWSGRSTDPGGFSALLLKRCSHCVRWRWQEMEDLLCWAIGTGMWWCCLIRECRRHGSLLNQSLK